MDLAEEELQMLTIPSLLRESVDIPRRSPNTFYLITLTLVFPLSFSILAHSLFTHPLLSHLSSGDRHGHDLTLLLLFQSLYLIFLFSFSLLSTSSVVFSVASLYSSKPLSFSSSLSSLPSVLPRLFLTFLWVALLMLSYYLLFLSSLFLLLFSLDRGNPFLVLLSSSAVLFLLLGVHVYITAFWHLASVVSVLEPVYGLAALRKSYHLLKGRVRMGWVLVFCYLFACGVINGVFGVVVVHGDEYGYGVLARILAGGFLVGVLVIVNLTGLLVQSVFYYVCKSYHHQSIDKLALSDHLGGYLGEYVPLKSSIQMENLDI
ncbi:hypothetical protein MLD38_019476 [Melastoma candidum]|uniref:Uncharacterized protein n=1 Tax=Melastoma candidum TaxID=119954 RepID=A0ACB9QY73_9MYRT|nr:hypothetical protein MLD38_019476 [Melastoma candidum]